jgi:hypothetical protein
VKALPVVAGLSVALATALALAVHWPPWPQVDGETRMHTDAASPPSLALEGGQPRWQRCTRSRRAVEATSLLRDVQVGNGGATGCGDGPALTTVSPNGDGVADSAVLAFRLAEPAVVSVMACRSRLGGLSTVWSTRRWLGPGMHRIVWHVDPRTPRRSHLLSIAARSRQRHVVVGDCLGGSPDARSPVVRVAGIAASFRRRSYRPGAHATLRIAAEASRLRLRVFRIDGGTHGAPAPGVRTITGTPVTAAVSVSWRPAIAHQPGELSTRIPRAWRSGLYAVRVAGRGEFGFAPLIVRPRRLGIEPIAVVLPTNTWAAYNFADRDGDGFGDTWYAFRGEDSVRLGMPYADGGAPPAWRNRGFLQWLGVTGRRADVLSDDDLDAITDAERLARAYSAIIFAGHEEYVTTHMYNLIRRYRDLGGNLAFLSANNLFWRVVRRGDTLTRDRQWRHLGRPEAALVGVQYRASDHGHHRGPYRIVDTQAAPWLFRDTGLRPGATFGSFGVEFDMRTPASPRTVRLIANVHPHFPDPAVRGEMVAYRLHGAQVFAAGTLSFADAAQSPAVSRLLANLWQRLSSRHTVPARADTK